MSAERGGLTNCLIAGVGGQGTVLASRLAAAAAIAAGFDARGSETIGMAQRGGSVTSHLRISAPGVAAPSPMICPGGADVVLAFEICEGARALEYLAPGALMVVCDRVIQPFSPSGAGGYDSGEVLSRILRAAGRALVVGGAEMTKKCGPRSLNVAMLGAAAARGAFPFPIERLEEVLRGRFSGEALKMNLKALKEGAEIACA